MKFAFELLEKCGLPAGVVNLGNGGKEAFDTLIDHPAVKAISFVGSTPVARYIYARAGEKGKRAQCQGGAKNSVVVLPDATWRWQRKSSRTAPSDAPGNAAWQSLLLSPWAKRKRPSATP